MIVHELSSLGGGLCSLSTLVIIIKFRCFHGSVGKICNHSQGTCNTFALEINFLPLVTICCLYLDVYVYILCV